MKIIYTIILAACVAGCQSSHSDGDANVARTRQMFDAFNRHDWQAMASYYSEPALFLDPSFGTDYVSKTRQETSAKYAEMEKIFPNIYDEIVGLYPCGDKVTIEFISSGTATDSSRFRLPIATVLTFKDGLIVKDATYYDNTGPAK
jgi:ketosteroid isomerase-like protein